MDMFLVRVISVCTCVNCPCYLSWSIVYVQCFTGPWTCFDCSCPVPPCNKVAHVRVTKPFARGPCSPRRCCLELEDKQYVSLCFTLYCTTLENILSMWQRPFSPDNLFFVYLVNEPFPGHLTSMWQLGYLAGINDIRQGHCHWLA